MVLCDKRYVVVFRCRFVALLKGCFPVGEFLLRELLSHNRDRVASFYRVILKFLIFPQKWFERNQSLDA